MTKNNQPTKKSSKPQPVALSSMFGVVIIVLQFVIGIIAILEIMILIRGYTTNDAEMRFLYISIPTIFVGSVALSIFVRGWLRWMWVGLALIAGIAIYGWITLFLEWR